MSLQLLNATHSQIANSFRFEGSDTFVDKKRLHTADQRRQKVQKKREHEKNWTARFPHVSVRFGLLCYVDFLRSTNAATPPPETRLELREEWARWASSLAAEGKPQKLSVPGKADFL